MKDDHIPEAIRNKETIVINLRGVPKSLHRALKIAAMDANMSMEQFIIVHLQQTIKQ